MKKVRKYDEKYQNQICEMMVVGRETTKELHKIMGMSIPTLIKWRKDYLHVMGSLKSDGKLKSAIEVDAELRAVRKELAQMKWEWEVLKIAASILANEPRTNMR